jgi:hypothetical protein
VKDLGTFTFLLNGKKELSAKEADPERTSYTYSPGKGWNEEAAERERLSARKKESVSIETHFGALRKAAEMIAMEKVKGAIRTLDMANSWEDYARGTASGHAERMRLQLDLMARALKQDRMAVETPRLNAGSFKHAEGVWNVLQRAVEGQAEAFDACRKAMDEAFEFIGREVAWKEIHSFLTSFGGGGINPRLWEPTAIMHQLRGEGLWQSDYDPIKGWVSRPRYEVPVFPSQPPVPKPLDPDAIHAPRPPSEAGDWVNRREIAKVLGVSLDSAHKIVKALGPASRGSRGSTWYERSRVMRYKAERELRDSRGKLRSGGHR